MSKPAWFDAFGKITAKTHTEQAIWWLNGFWREKHGEKVAEKIWEVAHLMIELQTGVAKLYGSKKALAEVQEGCDIDEMKSHVFLEKMGETLTVRDLRARLKELDVDQNRKMSLIEYLLAKYTVTPLAVTQCSQGEGDPAELARAQKAVQDAGVALEESLAAEAALRQAMAELEQEERAYNDACDKAEKISKDESLGVVKRNKGANELAQLKAEDPLPLRRAKITQASALKRAEKAARKAEEAFATAEAQLQALKSAGGGVAYGAIFWMERELAERRKFMPKGK